MEKKTVYYCRECGHNLFWNKVRADKVNVWHQDGMGGSLFRLDSAFNDQTGKGNFAEELMCPNWRRFFNNHDKIIQYKNELHYL